MASNRRPDEWKGRELHVYEDFVAFTAMPTALRQKQFGFEDDTKWREASKERLKRKSCVAISTVSRWKSNKLFWDDVRASMHEWAKNMTPSVIGSLLRTIARDGKASEVKLWMQIFEGFTEKIDNTVTQATVLEVEEDLSPKEIEAMKLLRAARRERIEALSDKEK